MSTINLQGGNTLLSSGFFPPVRVASTGSPLNPATGGLIVVDGVQLAAGDRVLCKDETSATNNGLYSANTGPWVRTSDATTNTQFFSGMGVVCALGILNAGKLFLCTCIDDPVIVGTSLITFAQQPISLSLTGLAITTASNTANQGLVISQSAAGSVNANQFALNSIIVNSNTIANNAPISFPLVDALLIKMNFGGSSFIGTAQALEVNLNMTATTSVSQPSNDYPCIESIATASANDNGTSGTPKGALFALGAQAKLLTGATFWDNVTGGEFNVGIQSGASCLIKTGFQIANEPDDAVQGSLIDAAIWLQAQSATPGWKNAFLIGGTGSAPMAATGTLIATSGNNGGTQITNGIDISSYSYSNDAIKTPNFSVTGFGGIGQAINPTVTWCIDETTSTITVTNGGNAALPAGSGLVVARETVSSHMVIVFFTNGTPSIVAQDSAGLFVVSTSPSSGHIGLGFNGVTYAIYNNIGSTETFEVFSIRFANS